MSESMLESSFKSRLNIHGIIDLDQMAAVLTSLIEQVDRQNKVINDLQKYISSLVTNNFFQEKTSLLESNLSKLSSRVDAVHEAATSTVLNKKISAGNLASSNYKHLAQLTKLVMDCATKVDLDVQRKDISHVQSNFNGFKLDFDKSLIVIDQLSKSQLNQSNRINILENSIACKIDRSECDHLESLVAKVELYDNFKVNTTSAIQQLQAFQVNSLNRYELYDNHFENIDSQLQQITIDVNKSATKQDIHLIAKELQNHESILQNCVFKSSFEEVKKEISDINIRHQLANNNISILQEQSIQFNLELNKKAGIALVRKEYVMRSHYEQALNTLSNEIELKTNNSVMTIVQENLEALTKQVHEESDQLSIAMRFVNWFSNRGENYEHNMKIIDKHLKGLIVSHPDSESSSHIHSYHIPGNKVMFTPSSLSANIN